MLIGHPEKFPQPAFEGASVSAGSSLIGECPPSSSAHDLGDALAQLVLAQPTGVEDEIVRQLSNSVV